MRLDSVSVLDLTRLLPGGYATQLLCDLGADVIKVEQPGRGDYARDMEPKVDGVGVVFAAVNQGKRSLTLDLKDDRGRSIFYELVEEADVVIEGFRPGVVERLGVDHQSLREHNPDIIYCSISGYGQTGPYRDRPGHDLNYIGLAGLLDMTRTHPDEPPTIPGFPVADAGGGLFAAFAIQSALLDRELGTGGGEYVDISMTDVVISFGGFLLAGAAVGEDTRSGHTPLTGQFPCYDVYETADGRYITLAALEPAFWERFCEGVDREDLVEAHLSDDASEREQVRRELEDLFASRSRDEWEAVLGDHDVMFGVVNTMEEVVDHPQVLARDLLVESPAPRVSFPAVVSGGLPDGRDAIPALGQHTEAVLGQHGLTDEEVAELREAGVV